VNISNPAGFLGRIQLGIQDKAKKDELVTRLSADDITIEDFDGYLKNFTETGTHAEHG